MFSSLKNQDWFLNGAVFFLALCGLAALLSHNTASFWQQAIWLCLGSILLWAFSLIDWRPLMNYRWLIVTIYLISLALLVATYFLAPTIRNTRSWIVIGPVQLQTSELAKLALIILFSFYFAHRHVGIARVGVLLKSFMYFAIPAALVLVQPDLGSTLILFFIWVGFLSLFILPTAQSLNLV